MKTNPAQTKPRQELIDFKRNYCVHYDPRTDSGCTAGVGRMTMKRAETPSSDGSRLIAWGPCIGGHTLANPCDYCPKWQRHTQEEAEQYADAMMQGIERNLKAMPVINAWRAKAPQGKREIITCPVCGGLLRLSQAAINSHVSARCETANCVHLIE